MGKRQKIKKKLKKKIPSQAPRAGVTDAEVKACFSLLHDGFAHKAEKSALKLVDRYPADKVSWLTAGSILLEIGKTSQALRAFKRAVSIDDKDPETHLKVGLAYLDLDFFREAEDSLSRANELSPHSALINYHLAIVRQHMNLPDLAEENYRAAIASTPNFAQAHNNLGGLLEKTNRLEEAEEQYRRAILIDGRYALAHSNLGTHFMSKGDYAKALKYFDNSAELLRVRTESNPAPIEAFQAISKAKVKHDIQQLEYLISVNLGEKHGKLSELVDRLRVVLKNTQWPSETAVIRLGNEHLELLAPFYNRLIYKDLAPRIETGALNEEIKENDITERYLEHEFGVVCIDALLSEAALRSLREYLLRSTIWFHIKKGGYLGAHVNEGLACPLLFQIAEELRFKFPKIFKNHRLNHIWAYKYDSDAAKGESDLSGIKIHADFAAVNVNFWVTPNEANLDPSTGGLIVHHVEAPLDWDFETFNNDSTEIYKVIEKQGRGQSIIPYRENRAVVFNSDLFHETDCFDFRPDYQHRRINVTMLFGDRQHQSG